MGAMAPTSARQALTTTLAPVDGSAGQLPVGLSLPGTEAQPRWPLEHEPEFGLSHRETFPVRMKKGTPTQRQFSISRRRAAYVSVVDP